MIVSPFSLAELTRVSSAKVVRLWSGRDPATSLVADDRGSTSMTSQIEIVSVDAENLAKEFAALLAVRG